MAIVKVVIQHFGDGIAHVVEDSMKGDLYVACVENLWIFYRKSRYYKPLKHHDLAYHACLVAQSLGYHASKLESQLKTQKTPKKAKKQDVDGKVQKGLF